MQVKEMKAKINFVQTLRGETTTIFRELLDEFRAKKAAINSNPDLSSKGKMNEIAKLQSVYERKALETSSKLQTEGKKVAEEVKVAAEKLLISDLPTVDDHTRNLFNQKAEELEAKVCFAVTPVRGMEALKQLVNLADHPVLAHEMKSKVLSLSESLLSMTNPAERTQLRREIGELYKAASEKGLPEGAQEAKQIIETADTLLNTSGISSVLNVPMREISITTSTFLHTPDEQLSRYNIEPPTYREQQRQNAADDLNKLREKAMRTSNVNDRIAYINAKADFERGSE